MKLYRYQALSLLILFSLTSFEVDAKQLYRWVDENGKVHYSDVIPPQHSKYGRTRLNERGLAVEQVEAAKSAEQLAQEKKLEALRAEKQRLIAEQRAADRVLLRTFRNVDEIEMTLNGKLQTIDLLNRLTRDNIARLEEKLAQQTARAATLERNGAPVPAKLKKGIKSSRNQIKDNKSKLASNDLEKKRLISKFGKDKERFIALTSKNRQTATSIQTSDKVEISVIECKSSSSCQKAWQKAKQYIAKNATTPLEIETETVLMTRKPVADKDLSLTVTRIEGKGDQATQLFLDVECKPSNIGIELCKSTSVKNILVGFTKLLPAGN